jgi:MYXO-CTERM domain-containing protein
MRIIRVIPWVAGGLFVAGAAGAQPLLDLTGQVTMLDGVAPGGARATLGMDLDRDGTLNSFEQVEVDVAEDGSYSIAYTPDPTKVDLEFLSFVASLLADYEARGFDAVLDDGPLPIVLKVEREGYSTIIKRFTTMSQTPTLDAVLAPLASIGCADGRCASSDGSVRLQDFPGGTGIERAYAAAYDPSRDTRYFPGAFTDVRSNLLISSGFAEINLHDSSGDKVTSVSSPVNVRFRADETSWPNLRDLRPSSGIVEVPMYSFDEDRADWVTEPDGRLETPGGDTIPEEDFASILDGSYPDPVFVSFDTRHFSTFNCDAPVNERGCVKGCLVTAEGEALGNLQVSANGVNYTGSAGGVITASDGCFASDVMRSELTDEDVDGDGRRGQTFQAQLVANGALGVFVGASFDTPSVRGTVGGSVSCRPTECDCIDLGEIEVTFEAPRACRVTVDVTYSGESLVGSGGPLASGDAVVGANIRGQLTGAFGGPGNAAVCGDEPCGASTASASGSATFVVAVIGDDPRIKLDASLSTKADGDYHYYEGSLTIPGCARGEEELSATVELELDHSSLGDLGDFISSLGPGPSGSGGNGSGGSSPFGGTFNGDGDGGTEDPLGGPGCGCRIAPASSSGAGPHALLGALALVLAGAARRTARRRH